MKFPRNARLLRSTFDVAPFAVVFFLLIIFMMLAALLPTPGLSLHLPAAGDLPGTDQPTVAVAIDAQGRLFFANQIVTEEELTSDLRDAVKKSREPLTLVVRADKTVTYDQLVRLALLAREPGIGITNLLLATLPRAINASGQP
jgi:biopolymer transport protein ExbD